MVDVSGERFPKIKVERKAGDEGTRKIETVIFCGNGTLRVANQVGVNFTGAVPVIEHGIPGYKITSGKEEIFLPAALCVVRFKYE